MSGMDDIAYVAIELGPTVPFGTRELAWAAWKLLGCAENRDQLRDLVAYAAQIAAVTNVSLEVVSGSLAKALDMAQAPPPPPSTILKLLATGYACIGLAADLATIEEPAALQRRLLAIGNYAVATLMTGLSGRPEMDPWRDQLKTLRGDLRLFEDTLKLDDEPAEEPPERRN